VKGASIVQMLIAGRCTCRHAAGAGGLAEPSWLPDASAVRAAALPPTEASALMELLVLAESCDPADVSNTAGIAQQAAAVLHSLHSWAAAVAHDGWRQQQPQRQQQQQQQPSLCAKEGEVTAGAQQLSAVLANGQGRQEEWEACRERERAWEWDEASDAAPAQTHPPANPSSASTNGGSSSSTSSSSGAALGVLNSQTVGEERVSDAAQGAGQASQSAPLAAASAGAAASAAAAGGEPRVEGAEGSASQVSPRCSTCMHRTSYI
jgi:hypothetical protein